MVQARAPVSVVIPCFRCGNTIERAVRSVVSQKLLPVELILIDDASGDRTLRTLYELRGRYRTLRIEIVPLEKNVGAGPARNIGWERATEPYIAFLDADDAWHPRKIEIQYGWMQEHPEVVLSGHWMVRMVGAQPTSEQLRMLCVRRLDRSMLIRNSLATSSVMLRREVRFRFNACRLYAEDYLLWLQLVLSGYPSYLLKTTLAYSFKYSFAGGLSGNLWGREKGELLTLWRLYQEGLIPIWVFSSIAPYSLVKFLRRVVLKQAQAT